MVKDLHSEKICGIAASQGGVVTCSTDKTVKLLTPDLDMNVINTIEGNEDLGEVTAVAHSKGILALGHSGEAIQVVMRTEE